MNSQFNPPILYSTITKLAYNINERYYDRKHWVWCGPYFDGRVAPPDVVIPPSASPCELYYAFREEVKREDDHGPKIIQNRVGILRGADLQREAGMISSVVHEEIIAWVNKSRFSDFEPLLYLIPFATASELSGFREARLLERANPYSREYIIEALPRHLFDVVRF